MCLVNLVVEEVWMHWVDLAHFNTLFEFNPPPKWFIIIIITRV
jgi:hypothetical protein